MHHISSPFLVKQCWRSGSGIWDFFDPRIRDGKKTRFRIRDEHPRSCFQRELRTVFRVKNNLILWCGSGIFLTRDPGWKTSVPWSTSRIRNTGLKILKTDTGRKRTHRHTLHVMDSLLALSCSRTPASSLEHTVPIPRRTPTSTHSLWSMPTWYTWCSIWCPISTAIAEQKEDGWPELIYRWGLQQFERNRLR